MRRMSEIDEPARRARPRWMVPLAALVMAAVAFGVAGCSSEPKPTKTFTMKGNVKLVLSLHDALQQLSQGGQCMPRHSGPYADVQEGATVTVYSAGGKVVATGALQAGVPSATDCTFPFTASGVPEGEKFYQVEVDHSGRMTVSAEKALKGDAVIELQLS